MPGSTSTYAADTEHLNTRLQGFEKRRSKHAAAPGRDVGIERRTEGIGRNPSVQPSLICEVRSEELLHRAKQSRTLQPDASEAGDASNVFFLRSGDAKVAEFERAPSRISGD